jgi:hypothetical protein
MDDCNLDYIKKVGKRERRERERGKKKKKLLRCGRY